MIGYFTKHANTVIDRYHTKVKYWMTFNEINSIVHGGFMNVGIFSDSLKDHEIASYHMFIASALTVQYTHEHYPNLQVGCMISMHCNYPYSCKAEDNLKSLHENNRTTYYYADVMCRGFISEYKQIAFQKENIHLPILEGDEEIIKNGIVDFIGISYYQTSVVSTSKEHNQVAENMSISVENPYLKRSEWGW